MREDGKMQLVNETRLVIDRDTGSAIKGPGRVDYLYGNRLRAQKMADSVYSDGELCYLLLRNT